MVDWYGGNDGLMRFLVKVKAVDDNMCKTNTCYDSQVGVCLREGKVCKSILLRLCGCVPGMVEVPHLYRQLRLMEINFWIIIL